MMERYRTTQVVAILVLLFHIGMYTVSSEGIVLVTGFESFNNYAVNPSQLIAETLNGSKIDDAKIIGMVLPVDFNESMKIATDAIKYYQPFFILCLGLNARARVIEIEKIGVNLKRYPKEDGTWSFPQRINVTSPFFRFSSIPTIHIIRKIREADIPVQQSYFAGTYVCNSLLYQLLGYTNEQNNSKKIGFIHVPLLDYQDSKGMPLQTMIEAVKITIHTCIM